MKVRKRNPWMSAGEIVSSYKNAKNRRTHPYILAELNDCDVTLILALLAERGFDMSDVRKPRYYGLA